MNERIDFVSGIIAVANIVRSNLVFTSQRTMNKRVSGYDIFLPTDPGDIRDCAPYALYILQHPRTGIVCHFTEDFLHSSTESR